MEWFCKYQYIIVCRHPIPSAFQIKDNFSLFNFQVNFVLKMEDNYCLLALSWIEI